MKYNQLVKSYLRPDLSAHFPISLLKTILPCLFLSCIISAAHSQSYFQQEVNYTIHVTLDDAKHELSASENIEYTNHSPTTLNELYFHLWPNAYKNDQTVLANEFVKNGDARIENLKDNDRGFIDSLDFKVLEFSKDDRRIVLSHKATWSAEEEKPMPKQQGGGQGGGKKGPVKNKAIESINQATEKSTLGDIEALSALKEKMSGGGEPKGE